MLSYILSPGFPGGAVGKESTRNAGDPGSIPGLGRSPGEQNGYPLQYSGLENSKDRGAWQATIHGVAISVRNDAAISNFCHPADAATPYSDGWGAGGTQEAATRALQGEQRQDQPQKAEVRRKGANSVSPEACPSHHRTLNCFT